MSWSPCLARKATAWIKSWSESTSHMGGLGESDEVGQELDELEEQLDESVEVCLGLGESVLGLGESGRETPNPSSLDSNQ